MATSEIGGISGVLISNEEATDAPESDSSWKYGIDMLFRLPSLLGYSHRFVSTTVGSGLVIEYSIVLASATIVPVCAKFD
jgi:hypothetical protein